MITSQEREQYHREMWNWLADHPSARKSCWPGWKKYNIKKRDLHSFKMSCFACGEDGTGCVGLGNCDNCPIDWAKNPDFEGEAPCLTVGSPFDEWKYAELSERRSFYALEIANLIWEKKMKLPSELRKRLHKRLWLWLADNPSMNKMDWPYWDIFIKIDFSSHVSGCFACGEAKKRLFSYEHSIFPYARCSRCPIDWKAPDCGSKYYTAYNQWRRAEHPEERKRLALLIANLTWKER